MQYLITGVVFFFFVAFVWLVLWVMEKHERRVIAIAVYMFFLVMALILGGALLALSWDTAGKLMEYLFEPVSNRLVVGGWL